MLDITNTRYFQVTEEPVHSADIANIVEGQGLVYKMEAGIGKVGLVSDGKQKFAGVAVAGYVRPKTLTQVDEFMPADDKLVFSLTYKPAGEKVEVFNATAGKMMVANTDYTFDAATNEITFKAEAAGSVAKVTYRLEATLAQAREAAGDGYPGGYQIAQLNGTVGVIAQGEISTDQFDVASDFTAEGPVYVDANGYFTKTSDQNVEVPNARVLAAPGAGSQFLRLKLV